MRVARSTALVLAVVTASKTATIFLSSVVVVATGSTPRGSSNVARFGGVSSTFGIRAVESNNAALTMSIPRGGDEPGVEKLTKEKDDNENDNEEDIVETLYLPGLLHASVSRKTVSFSRKKETGEEELRGGKLSFIKIRRNLTLLIIEWTSYSLIRCIS